MNTAPPDSPDSPSLEQTAAEAREAIVANSESHAWNGIPLAPWSQECASLLARIVALDVPGGALDELPQLQARLEDIQARESGAAHLHLADVADLQTYLPTAAKLLYIAAVPRSQWFHLRSRPQALIAAIEAWCAENIAPDQVCEACLLAQRIASDHHQIIAMTRSRKGVAGGHEGN